MEISSLFNDWLALAMTSPATSLLFDLFLKSTVLLLVFLGIGYVVRSYFSSRSRHLLWFHALASLALLPVLPQMTAFIGPEISSAPALFYVTVLPSSVTPATAVNWEVVIIAVYLLPCAWLLLRLLTAMARLLIIRRDSLPVQNIQLLAQLQTTRQQLGISRDVTLRYSNKIESPLSFGVFAPQIILPTQAESWSASVVADVLIHELCHIRRLDWPSMVFSYLVASVYWLNPLVWLVLKKINNEAENSCDTAVLQAGRSETGYAESLLRVAKACIHANRHKHALVLAQSMLDKNTLTFRITRILEENVMKASDYKQEFKKAAVFLSLLSAGLLTAVGATQIVSAQTPWQPDTEQKADVEMLPLHSEIPNYPRSAAEAGIEGWVLVRFTVNAEGSVDTGSIEVVDYEPSEVFNVSAMDATTRFLFSPRVRDGQAVAVPNVQYVFRYQLQAPVEE
ncbi:MAG: M56 family metallopeptidase [Pseudohongiellaceae bacterium]